jgi:lipopolysaccharide/colanic/teichoic acid biosynthesis glycosyltransferase
MLSSNSSCPPQRAFSRADPPIPVWKRSLDIACCIVALPILVVAAMFISLYLALVSAGPVFYRQERVGYMGRRFMLYKFRTMHVGVETASHRAHVSSLLNSSRPMQKLDATRDSRLVPGGWLLRATGIDELPQLINVLLGDMSLVGPRPCIPYEYEQYSAWQRARFTTAPGLTGLWQVSGKNRTTFEEMIRLDIQYSQTKSLWLDLKIIALTLPALWVQVADTHVLRRAPAVPGVGAPSPSGSAASLRT